MATTGGESSTGGEPIVGGPRTHQQQAAQRRLQQTQAQVDEVIGVMRLNVEKVLERDQRLTELDCRSDALQQGASQFEQQAGKLKRKYWWKNLKMMIIMGAIGLIIIIIIGIWLSGGSGGGSSSETPTTVTPKAERLVMSPEAATAPDSASKPSGRNVINSPTVGHF